MPTHEEVMKIWIDSAKTCASLATAAMFLPVFLTRELAGVPKDSPLKVGVTDDMIYAWIAWIIAIALSNTYQISAAKLFATGGHAKVFALPQYWGMVVALVAGLGWFAHGALAVIRPILH